MALSKTGIEYLDQVWNFYPGCNHWKTGICPVGEKCWAKNMAHRFHRNFEPQLLPEKLLDPLLGKQEGKRIGVCFTGDLCGDWVDPDELVKMDVTYLMPDLLQVALSFSDTKVEASDKLKWWVFNSINRRPQDTFIFLTKNPSGLAKWSPFPDNCCVGVSATHRSMLEDSLTHLAKVEAKVKFVSIEPMLGTFLALTRHWFLNTGVKWVIIGQQTPSSVKTQPEVERIRDIVDAADGAGAAVFLKNNLEPLIESAGMARAEWAAREWVQCKYPVLRQEYPKELVKQN